MKPGDTVDPRTLPVGAVFEYKPNCTGHQWRVTGPGASTINEPDCAEVSTLDTPAILVSLPQPIADEVVELGTLAKGDSFELVELPPGFNPQWLGALLQVTGTYPSGAVDATIVRPVVPGGYRSSGVLTETTKVRRVPAPTPTRQPGAGGSCSAPRAGAVRHDGRAVAVASGGSAYGAGHGSVIVVGHAGYASGTNGSSDVMRNAKRPPCDACGEESVPYTADQPYYTIIIRDEQTYLCKRCTGLSAAQNRFDIRARRAKQTSGSTGPLNETQADSVNQHEPEASRWQTRDPARTAALEAKLAEQVRSGGQDGKSARWLLERADVLRREEEARQSSKWGGERVQWRDKDGNLCAKVTNETGITAGPVFNRRDYRPRARRKG